MAKRDFRYGDLSVRVTETAPRSYSAVIWGPDLELRIPGMITVPPGVFYGDMAPRTVAQSVVNDLVEAQRSTRDEFLGMMETRLRNPGAPVPSDVREYADALYGADPGFGGHLAEAARAVQDEWTVGEEGGVTRWSLHNARALISRHGLPERVALLTDDRGEWVIEAHWPGLTHRFLGFSWGYSGEGPRGLEEFFGMLGADPAVTMREIGASLVRIRVHKRIEYRFPPGPKEWQPGAWTGRMYHKGVDYGKA